MAAFPSLPYYQSISQTRKHYSLKSESINGRIQVRSLGASRRSWSITWPPMTRAEFDVIYTFIDETLEGDLNTFTIVIPNPKDPLNDETVTCRIDGDVQSYDIGTDNLVQFELDIVEVL